MRGMLSVLGEGLKKDDSSKPKMAPQGVEIQISCPHCSTFAPLLIEWQEVQAMAQDKPVQGFRKTATGYVYSSICPVCEQHYLLQGKQYKVRPGMAGREAQIAAQRQQEISMSRPIGLETARRWLLIGKQAGLV